MRILRESTTALAHKYNQIGVNGEAKLSHFDIFYGWKLVDYSGGPSWALLLMDGWNSVATMPDFRVI